MRVEPVKLEHFVSFITTRYSRCFFRGKTSEIVDWRDHKNTQCYQNNDTRAYCPAVSTILL